jgi:hypothetical protein
MVVSGVTAGPGEGAATGSAVHRSLVTYLDLAGKQAFVLDPQLLDRGMLAE